MFQSNPYETNKVIILIQIFSTILFHRISRCDGGKAPEEHTVGTMFFTADK